MSGVQLNSGNALLSQIGGGQVINTSNKLYPPSGPRVISLQYNWATSPGNLGYFVEDFSQQVFLGSIDTIQCVYIDNTSNNWPVKIVIGQSGQVINCPGNSAGFYDCYIGSNPFYTVLSVPDNVYTQPYSDPALRNFGFTRLLWCNFSCPSLVDPNYYNSNIGSMSLIATVNGALPGQYNAIIYNPAYSNPASIGWPSGLPYRSYFLNSMTVYVQAFGAVTAASIGAVQFFDGNTETFIVTWPLNFTAGDTSWKTIQLVNIGFPLVNPIATTGQGFFVNSLTPPTGATGFNYLFNMQLSMA